jgi:D-lyxose ketol-isomerase
MKRSEINAAIRQMLDVCRRYQFALPPFAHWPPDRWRQVGPEADEIRRCMLGWDVTDLGTGDFAHTGLTLFTVRNGDPRAVDGGGKTYCEKIMMSRPGQFCSMHFHDNKMEDIICRGGGPLLLTLHNATDDDRLADTPVTVSCDGVERTVPAGTTVRLSAGESITLPPRLYHNFRAAPDGEPCLIGEVSKVNDDERDNHFLDPLGRFPAIEEDEPPLHLLCNEYPPAG